MTNHRRAIIIALERQLPASFVVVSLCDHPHLYRPPDVVVAGDGRILAVFFVGPTPAPSRELQARVIATRLSFPGNVTLVAVHKVDVVHDSLGLMFDYNVPLDRAPAEILSLAQSTDARPRAATPPEVRQAAYTRYEVLRLYAESRLRRATTPIEPLDSIQSLDPGRTEMVAPLRKAITGRPTQENRKHLIREIVTTELGHAATVDLSDGRSFNTALGRIYTLGFLDSFNLDNGVPYLGRLSSSLLAVATWPIDAADPGKPLRAAAFSGWMLTYLDRDDDVSHLLDRLNDSLSRRLMRGRP